MSQRLSQRRKEDIEKRLFIESWVLLKLWQTESLKEKPTFPSFLTRMLLWCASVTLGFVSCWVFTVCYLWLKFCEWRLGPPPRFRLFWHRQEVKDFIWVLVFVGTKSRSCRQTRVMCKLMCKLMCKPCLIMKAVYDPCIISSFHFYDRDSKELNHPLDGLVVVIYTLWATERCHKHESTAEKKGSLLLLLLQRKLKNPNEESKQLFNEASLQNEPDMLDWSLSLR